MYRILVVEDEDDIQKILKNYLIDQGYTVTLAYDGVDGIQNFTMASLILCCWML